jgi:hypothetical protein
MSGAIVGVSTHSRSEGSRVRDVRWKDDPENHDYPAAVAYLSLLLPDAEVARVTAALRVAAPDLRKAKDVLRAARLALLPADNPHVAADLQKVADGKALSPVLLVRGDFRADIPLQIADGYHRVCAAYHVAENTDVCCRIVSAGPNSP